MKKVNIITNCPSCSSKLERVNSQLFCRNKDCAATSAKKVSTFISKMKIKGLGAKTVEKLGINTIHDIYSLSKEYIIEKLGSKLGSKLIAEIDKSKSVTLDKYISAFSIQLIGDTAGVKLAKLTNRVEDITFALAKKAGLGDKAAYYVSEWVIHEYPKYKDLPINISSSKAEKVESIGIKVCITGLLKDFPNRARASEYLEGKGITVVSGVSKSLDYLICEDKSTSSKTKKAIEYNIPIVTITKLIEELKL